VVLGSLTGVFDQRTPSPTAWVQGCNAVGSPRPLRARQAGRTCQPPGFDGLRLPVVPIDLSACFSFFAVRFSFNDIPGFLALGLLGDLSPI
jgi:hypothetical protein